MPTEADQTESSYICMLNSSTGVSVCIVKILPVVSIPVQITTGNK